MPRVSVSIPCHNAVSTSQEEQWLRRSIESVLNQTVTDLELLLIDDGSTDRTFEVLQEYTDDGRVSCIRQENQGYAGARNTGLEEGSGEYFAFIGQDDRWLPDKLERQLSVIEKQDADIVHSNVYHIDREGNRRGIRQSEYPPQQIGNRDFIRELFLGNFICIQSVLARQEAIGDHRFDEKFHINCDHDMWLRLASECNIQYLDELLVEKRYHGNNTSSNYERMFEERKHIAEKMVDVYPFLKSLRGRKLGDAYYMYGKDLLENGEARRARQAILKAICHDPSNLESYGTFLASLLGSRLGRVVISWISNPRPGRLLD
jgi:glycosyltransferase involved in cell wall biosynthesis